MATSSCLRCAADFVGTRAWQKYCTPLCRDNSPSHREKTRKFQAARRAWINSIKVGLGCAHCGYRDHPAALDFNHTRGEKLFNVSQDPKRSLASLKAEIAKCEVLCANCHRIHTVEEGHNHSNRRSAQCSQ